MIELFEMTDKEAGEFIAADGVRIIDVQDNYRLYARSVSDNVKLRHYGSDNTFKLEIIVPNKLQCVPCGIDYRTEKHGECPCCKTLNRDVMLRNKTFEEPFRKFEAIYSDMLNAALRVAQPVMMFVSDNFDEEETVIKYKQARETFDLKRDELKQFGFIFKDGIIEEIKEIKKEKSNVEAMRILIGGDSSAEAIELFRR